MHKVNPAKLFAALLFVAFAPAAARAQAGGANRTGSLVGVVWDSTRMSPLASALVGLKDTKFSVLTNVDGRFFIPNLPVGEYTVLVSHARLDSLRVLMPQVVVNILPDSQVTVSVALPVLSTELTKADIDTVTAWLGSLGIRVDEALRSRIRAGGGQLSDLNAVVIERANRRPIGGALAELEGSGKTGLTDPNGRLQFRDVPPGTYTLKVTMLGYSERRQEIEIPPGQILDLRVDLSPQPITLSPIVVQVRSRALDRAGFYDRKNDRATWGRFFTAADLQRRNLGDLSDLFHSIPGAKVIYGGVGKRRILFNRLTGSDAEGCEPPIFIDGQAVANALEIVSTSWVEGIEVYIGLKTPIEFQKGAACGAILVWTKHGG